MVPHPPLFGYKSPLALVGVRFKPHDKTSSQYFFPNVVHWLSLNAICLTIFNKYHERFFLDTKNILLAFRAEEFAGSSRHPSLLGWPPHNQARSEKLLSPSISLVQKALCRNQKQHTRKGLSNLANLQDLAVLAQHEWYILAESLLEKAGWETKQSPKGPCTAITKSQECVHIESAARAGKNLRQFKTL